MSARENGFTLIEMLVALAVFSLAALALLRLEGATVASTARHGVQSVGGVSGQESDSPWPGGSIAAPGSSAAERPGAGTSTTASPGWPRQ